MEFQFPQLDPDVADPRENWDPNRAPSFTGPKAFVGDEGDNVLEDRDYWYDVPTNAFGSSDGMTTSYRFHSRDGGWELFGNGGNDVVRGFGGDDTLHGGNDNDILDGGTGKDKLYGDSGIDTATYQGATAFVVADLILPELNRGEAAGDSYFSIENLAGSAYADDLFGDDNVNQIWGHNGDDHIFGRGGDDTIDGGAGNDWLDGGPGGDRMEGGADDDRYLADSWGDDVVETPWGGIDRVSTLLPTYRLDDNVEHLFFGDFFGFTDTRPHRGYGNDLNNIMVGGDGDDTFFGGRGNDEFYGRGGRDVMFGEQGDDIYFVNSWDDVASELSIYFFGLSYDSGGLDTIITTLPSYELEEDYDSIIENLTYNGTENFTGTGNSADNWITGSVGWDVLAGGFGKDTLSGGDNNDTLDGGADSDVLHGGAGVDIMVGGNGDDHYFVDDPDDTVVELPDEGYDTVESTATTYRLRENAEALLYQGAATAAFHGVGNGLSNTIVGLVGDDLLEGADGNDTLIGYNPWGDYSPDSGLDTLDGGAGDDELTGGNQADTFKFSDGWGHDIVTDFSVSDGDRLDLTGVTRPIAITEVDVAVPDWMGGTTMIPSARIADDAGNSIVLTGVANASLTAANFLSSAPILPQSFEGTAFWGGTIQGTGGVDTVSYANANYSIYVDLLREGGYAEGSGQSAHLSSIENITGSSTLLNYLHGNHEDNVLIGGDHFDWLTGRGGNNTLDGRGFINMADYYETNAPVTIDLTVGRAYHSTGIDTLINIQQFRTTNTADEFIGDGQDNYVLGMNGDDRIYGGAGRDTLDGSGDNDILAGGADDDQLSGSTGADRFVYDDYDAGHDRILDFNAEDGDRIDFSPSVNVDDYSDLTVGDDGAGNAILTFGQSSIVLAGIAASQVSQDWMLF